MLRFFSIIILLYSIFIMGCSDDLVYNSTQTSSVYGLVGSKKDFNKSNSEIAHGIFAGINQIRSKNGLSRLRRAPELDAVAMEYSKRMAKAGAISHVDSNGKRMEDRLEEFSIVDWSEAGENLASSTAGAEPVQSALWGWQRSPGHMENILLPTFVYTGVGAYKDPVSGEVFITQLFLTP